MAIRKEEKPAPCTRLVNGKPRHYWQRIQPERNYGFKVSSHKCWYCNQIKRS